MRIGIFGGSFNPPHKMHLEIASKLIINDYVDKVIFVPTGDRYEKNDLINATDRLNMLKIMTENYPNLEVSSYEIKTKQIYTYQTLDYFKKKFPTAQIYFICGIDNLNYINEWKNSDYILNNYKILVIKRDKQKIKTNNKNIIITNIEENNTSSTLIRKKIKLSEDVSSYIDINVLKYIEKRNLYEKNS